MTVLASPPTSAATCAVRPPTALVDASTRGPVLLLAGGAVKWLVLSLLAGLISSMKLHMPGLLAGIPALTYGRLVALQDAVFIYGFASQAAAAVAIWLICRLGATTLVGGGVIVVAGLLWNLGVVVGAVGILAGNGSPFAHFQFPQAALLILFVAFLLIGVCALLTFVSRKECSMYPALWFALAGLIFFPWALGTATMTLWSPNVRGGASPLIAAWAGNQVVALWLGSIALASLYYFLPKLTGKSLHSHGLAVFAFWLYALFAQPGGMHATAAFPAWVSSLSEIATVLLLLPAAATAVNWRQTLAGKAARKTGDHAYNFAWWGGAFYFASAVLAAFAALRPAGRVLDFTIFQAGLSGLFLLGFVTMSMFAAFTYILPRALDMEWPRPALSSLHYRLTLLGAFLVIGGLLLGGVIQGLKARDIVGSPDYLGVVRSTFPFVGIAIVGFLTLIVAQIAFLANLTQMFATVCMNCKGGAK